MAASPASAARRRASSRLAGAPAKGAIACTISVLQRRVERAAHLDRALGGRLRRARGEHSRHRASREQRSGVEQAPQQTVPLAAPAPRCIRIDPGCHGGRRAHAGRASHPPVALAPNFQAPKPMRRAPAPTARVIAAAAQPNLPACAERSMEGRMAALGSFASVANAEESTVALFPAGGFYRPGRSYDEMFAADGDRPPPLRGAADADDDAGAGRARRPPADARTVLPAAGHHLHRLWRRADDRADHPDRPLPAHHSRRRVGEDRGRPDPAPARAESLPAPTSTANRRSWPTGLRRASSCWALRPTAARCAACSCRTTPS